MSDSYFFLSAEQKVNLRTRQEEIMNGEKMGWNDEVNKDLIKMFIIPLLLSVGIIAITYLVVS